MPITPAVLPAQYYQPLTKQGCYDADLMNQQNAFQAAQDILLASSVNSALAFGSFGTAITLLPATAPAGLYIVSVYAVVTTTIVTATSWLFTLGYTDDKQAQTATVSTSSTLTAGTAEQGTFTFRSNGTAAITITPTATSISAGVISYSVTLQRVL
jgi:hypothetical protein